MKKGDLIFVYGTLRLNERASLGTNERAADVKYVGDDLVNGLLYNLGGYPGLKITDLTFSESRPTVVGEVFRLLTDSIVAVLDAYEGYPFLYGRQTMRTQGGLSVWAYTYVPTVPLSSLIVNGDWCNRDLDVSKLSASLPNVAKAA